MRGYKCLNNNCFEFDNYKLLPVRDQYKYDILNWRNSQIEILKQNLPLSTFEQEVYFKNVVDKLFEKEKPDQILWSFFYVTN